MPSFNWSVDPISLIQQFESQHNNPDAGALFIWAVSTVDCLYYLDDIDRNFDSSREPLLDHKPDVIDVAHARWATGTSITALDLCAAGLGRAFCSQTEKRELDLENFNPNAKRSKASIANHAKLPLEAQNWVEAVFADSKYITVKSARDWLTHSRPSRQFYLSIGGPPQRLDIQFGSTQLPVRELIEFARDFASHHVLSFIQLLPRL